MRKRIILGNQKRVPARDPRLPFDFTNHATGDAVRPWFFANQFPTENTARDAFH